MTHDNGKKQPFEDVSPIKKCDFPLTCFSFREGNGVFDFSTLLYSPVLTLPPIIMGVENGIRKTPSMIVGGRLST